MAETFRAQEAVLTVEDEDEEEVDVGIIQEVTVEPEKETEELRGFGSRMRQDEMATEISVSVSAEFMAFTETGLQDLMGTEDDDGTTILEDTSDLSLFEISGEFLDTSGESFTIVVKDVYFESIPISGSRDDWIGLDLEGTGKTLEFS